MLSFLGCKLYQVSYRLCDVTVVRSDIKFPVTMKETFDWEDDLLQMGMMRVT